MAALRASSAKASALPVPTSTSKGAGQVLGLGLVAVTGPFVGQKPIVAIVGPDAAPATEAMRPAIAHWSEGNDVLVVQVGGTALLAEGTRRYSGNYLEQLRLALADGDSAIARGEADYVAVILRLPITGTFTSDKDICRQIFGTVFDGNRDALVTWLGPIELGPDNVMVSLSSKQGRDIRQTFAQMGSSGWEYLPDAAFLPLRDAVLATVALLGDANGYLISEDKDAAPKYDAEAQLILGHSALADMRARVDRVDNDQALLAVKDLRIGRLVDGVIAEIDLPQLLVQRIAYLFVDKSARRIHQPQGAPVSQGLEKAILAGDQVAAAVELAGSGRSWLETERPQVQLSVVERAGTTFAYGSRAWAWSHFLVALDGMLREGRADASSFEREDISAADRLGLGLLFRAEAMEFARVRGDGAIACAWARELIPMLSEARATGEFDLDYATGTSAFLVGNLMRWGGRYEAAEGWIRLALSVLDQGESASPAMATEVLHCQYALNVCSSMQGRPLLIDPLTTSDKLDLFARGLVTLSNGNACWILHDIRGAKEHTANAAEQFQRIGYSRYAQRAQDLNRLIEMWGSLAQGRTELLKSARWELLNNMVLGGSDVVDLSGLRPSRALGFLAFGLEYGDPTASRMTILPGVLSDELVMGEKWQADSLEEADYELRRRMSLTTPARVPLLAD